MTQLSSALLHRLDRFAVIAVSGGDAKSYLQGQLSFDIDRLTPGRMELSCCNSAQGRVQAVLWLIERSDATLMLLSSDLVQSTLTRLKKYVLRAKVKLEVSDRFAVFAATNVDLDTSPQAHVEAGDRTYVRWPGDPARYLCIAPADSAEVDPLVEAAWRHADIAAGLPQVYAQTHESFVAQMLNLDLLGGISFEKGCYTGQEIIARTHFRGAIKRRMFRYRTDGAMPEPGSRVVLGEQHAGDVVDAVATSSGSELLAIVSLAHAEAQLQLASGAKLEKLPLPYQL
jgi:tRNA-modifying protein YgfZ